MKKRLWKLPQSSSTSVAVDIPQLEKKKKNGAPFWMRFSGSTPALYGSVAGIGAGSTAVGAAGGLVLTMRALASYGPATLRGKLAAALMLLTSVGAFATGAIFFSAAATPAYVPLPALRGIANIIHYKEAFSNAASGVRDSEFSAPPMAQQSMGKAADAAVAGGFTGNTAPGAPIGQAGTQASPVSAQNGASQQATGGSMWQRLISAGGILGGAFDQSAGGNGKAGQRVMANDGNPLTNLGAFGMALSESLGRLRAIALYNAGITGGSPQTPEAPAQLATEQFDDNSNITNASGPQTNAGTPSYPGGVGGSGNGAGGGNRAASAPESCAKDMYWNGSGCAPFTQGPLPGSNQ